MIEDNFLLNFDLKLQDLFKGNTFSKDKLNYLFKTKRINIYSRGSQKLVLDLEEINEVLDRIIHIINKPRVVTSKTSVVLRGEQASALDEESFQNTLRDSSLWSKKNNEMVPEYVYSTENTESILTYENKFIKFLFLYISRYIKNFNKSQVTTLSSIYEYFRQNELTYSPSSIINYINDDNLEFTNYLFLKDSTNKDTVRLLNIIFKKIKYIESSSFYKILKNETITLPIERTNILIHDQSYNFCYQYYKKNVSYFRTYADEDLSYFNYVSYRILTYIYDNNYELNDDFSLSVIQNELNIHNLIIIKDKFNIEINTENRKLIINVKLNDLVEKYILLPKLLLESVDRKDDNLIYVTLNNKANIYEKVLQMSYFKKNDDDSEIDILFKSFTLNLRNPSRTLQKCLVCGSLELEQNNNYYECLKCNSQFVTFKREYKTYVWIKKIVKK